ncbi:hypothetical protein AAE478_008236 [Parahypoxylon ruwenzoriense]
MSQQHEDVVASGPTSAKRLTRRNLEDFTVAVRRDEAYRRGDPTPSPDPDMHEYNSSDSRRPSFQDLFPPRTLEEEEKMGKNWEIVQAALAKTGLVQLGEEQASTGNVGRKRDQVLPSQQLQHTGITTVDGALGSIRDGPQDEPQNGTQVRGSMSKSDNKLGEIRPSVSALTTMEAKILARLGVIPVKDAQGNVVGYRDANAPPPRRPLDGTRNRHLSSQSIGNPPPPPQPNELRSLLPTNFPRYRATQHINEVGAYLANASYVVSLGGPPLADLKYGIIVVPVCQETLLFGEKPDGVMTQSFLDAVDEAKHVRRETRGMHEPDRDSDEFLRHRFTSRERGTEHSSNSLADNHPQVFDSPLFPYASNDKPHSGRMEDIAGIPEVGADTGIDNAAPNGKRPYRSKRKRNTIRGSHALAESSGTAIRGNQDDRSLDSGIIDGDIMLSGVPPVEAAGDSPDGKMVPGTEEQSKGKRAPRTTRITRVSKVPDKMTGETQDEPVPDAKSSVQPRSSSSPQRAQRGRPKRPLKVDTSKPQGITKKRAGNPQIGIANNSRFRVRKINN